MCSLITEKEIQQFSFTPAKNNIARYWQSKAEEIIKDGKNEEELYISFTGNGGSFRVKTKIIAVIENYVRISDDVVIPFTSINKIYPEMPPKIVVQDNTRSYYKIMLLLLLIALVFLALLYIFIR
jgi:hypothetical protein